MNALDVIADLGGKLLDHFAPEPPRPNCSSSTAPKADPRLRLYDLLHGTCSTCPTHDAIVRLR